MLNLYLKHYQECVADAAALLQANSPAWYELDAREQARKDLIYRYSWAVPDDKALRIIKRYSPILEVGAGTGYWSALLRDQGADVMAFDRNPPRTGRNSYKHRTQYTWIHQGPAEVSAFFPDRTLFICWPPYDTNMASRALECYQGKHVIFVGESWGGCTGDERFHQLLSNDFTLIREYQHPNWGGLHDKLYVYRRNDHVVAKP